MTGSPGPGASTSLALSSRLERLVRVLETGATSEVRREAAREVGQLDRGAAARGDGDDVDGGGTHGALRRRGVLLEKLAHLLRSESWETRVAAGHAVAHVAANVPVWASSSPQGGSHVPGGREVGCEVASLEVLGAFDVGLVLAQGLVMGKHRAGEPLTILGDFKGQMSELRKSLGLDRGVGRFVRLDRFIRESDLAANQSFKGGDRENGEGRGRDAKELLRPQGGKTLSARERAKLKRKRGHAQGEEEGGGGAEEVRKEDEWPMQAFAEGLCEDVLDARWEVRHGAAVGLRALLKRHAECVGVAKPAGKGAVPPSSSLEAAAADNAAWLEGCAARLLCVLALDRFSDFSGHGLVAPVRETAASCVALVAASAPPVLRDRVLSLLGELGRTVDVWEVRHACFLALKYFVVAAGRGTVESSGSGGRVGHLSGSAQAWAAEMAPRLMPLLCSGLEDPHDDVRAAAAFALRPVAADFAGADPAAALGVLAGLVNDLGSSPDELSTSTVTVLALFSALLRAPSVLEMLLGDTARGALSPQLLLVAFLPFARHRQAAVRLAALRAVSDVTDVVKKSARGSWSPAIACHALAHLFCAVVAEDDCHVRAQAVAAWARVGDASRFPADDAGALLLRLARRLVDHATAPHGSDDEACVAAFPLPGRGGKAPPPPRTGKGSSQPASSSSDTPSTLDEGAVIGTRVVACLLLGRLLRRHLRHDRGASDLVGILREILVVERPARALRIACASHVVFEAWLGPSSPLRHRAHAYLACDPAGAGSAAGEEPTGEESQHAEHASSSSLAFLAEPAGPWIFDGGRTEDGSALGEALLDALAPSSAGASVALYAEALPWAHVLANECHAMRSSLAALTEHLSSSISLPFPSPEDVLHGTFDSVSTSLSAGLGRLEQVVSVLGSDPRATRRVRDALPPIQTRVKAVREAWASLKEVQGAATRRARSATSAACLAVILQTQKTTSNTGVQRWESLVPPLLDEIEHEGAAPALQSSSAFALALLMQASCLVPPKLCEFLSSPEFGPPDEGTSEDLVSVAYRGACETFASLCALLGDSLLDESSPGREVYVEHIARPLGLLPPGPGACSTEVTEQSLCTAASLLSVLGPSLATLGLGEGNAVRTLLPCLDRLFDLFGSPALHGHAFRCALAFCGALVDEAMPLAVAKLAPLLLDGRGGGGLQQQQHQEQQHAIDVLAGLLDGSPMRLRPWAVFWVRPLLSRMGASSSANQGPHQELRRSACRTFANLLPVLLIEETCPDPGTLRASPTLSSEKVALRTFARKLLGSDRPDPVVLPFATARALRAYQREGVEWLHFLATSGLSGALCDEMGLGKTLQALCAVALAHHGESATQHQRRARSLVLCPPTLVSHWCDEASASLPGRDLSLVGYGGSPDERSALRARLDGGQGDGGSDRVDVVVAGYDAFRRDADWFSRTHWCYVVLDEGHQIRNAKTKLAAAVKALSSSHRLIISGTPIQNNVGELWSLFDFLMPGFLGSRARFRATYGQALSAASPGAAKSKRTGERAAAAELALGDLHKRVLPFVLRRLKADVLDDLPPKILQDVSVDLGPVQRLLYDAYFAAVTSPEGGDGGNGGGPPGAPGVAAELLRLGADAAALGEEGAAAPLQPQSADRKGVFQALSYLRKVVCHPLLVLDSASHALAADALRAGRVRDLDGLRALEHSPKLLALRDLLLQCGIGRDASVDVGDEVDPDATRGSDGEGRHRVLVFAQHRGMLDLIERDLFGSALAGVSWLRLDGSVPQGQRPALVRRFETDPAVDVFLLTTRVGGLGLTLTGADTVVFVEHDWNPMVDLQAMDRAHRLGQTRVVNVYRIVARDCLEEQIMGLQAFKLGVAAAVVNSDNASMRTMATDTIVDLFPSHPPREGGGGLEARGKGGAKGGPPGSGLQAMLAALPDLQHMQDDQWL